MEENIRQRIIDVASNLFIEHGYNNTTIQDIIDNLSGLTKGAIYYYFESKRDILDCILEENLLENEKQKVNGKNNLEKLSNIVADEIEYKRQEIKIKSSPIYLKTPEMIGEYYFELKKIKRKYIEYIEAGIEEGVIETNYSDEVIEFVLLFFHINMNLHIFELTKEEYLRKFLFIKLVLEASGIFFINEELIIKAEKLYDDTHKNKV